MTDIKKSLRKLVESNDATFHICSIIDVNKVNATCVCQPINQEAKILDVKLRAATIKNSDGFIVYPAIDSIVIVAMLNRNSSFIAMTSEIESINVLDNVEVTFNRGLNAGLVNIKPLLRELQVLNNNVNIMRAAVASGFTALSGIDSGASSSIYNGLTSAMVVQNLLDLEDNKIKH